MALAAVPALSSQDEGCESCEEPSPQLTIYAAGDTTVQGFLPERPGGEAQQLHLSDLMSDADLFIFNNEGALIDPAAAGNACAPFGRQSVFHNAPEFADLLSLARYNVAVLANNHIFDCRVAGVGTTIEAFKSKGFATVGAGKDAEHACAPQVFEVDGLRVGVLGYLAHSAERFAMQDGGAGAATWEGCNGEEQVRELADTTDLVVISLHLHLSRSWTEFAADEHQALARSALAAGADIVIGHGPHIPQGVMLSDGGVALLSLGNFIFDPGYPLPDLATRGVMARIAVFPETLIVDLLPLRLDSSGWPAPAGEADGKRIARALIVLSSGLGTRMSETRTGARVRVQRRNAGKG